MDLNSGELRRGGILVKLAHQPFRILTLIASRSGRVVTREEIQQQIWGSDTFVDFEQGMNQCIKQIRNALGDNAEKPRYVETLPRRGYRFLVPVEQLAPRPVSVDSSERVTTTAEIAQHTEAAEPQRVASQMRSYSAIRIAALAAAVAVASIVTFRWFTHSRPEASIAVLPFADLSPAKNQEYLSDGLADELVNRLARIPELHVAGRTSSLRFRHEAENFRSIGKALNVAMIIEGSVRVQGSQARIAVRLIKTADGFQLWSQTFDRDTDDILSVEEGIARAVTGELSLLLAKNTTTTYEGTRNPAAYNAFLQGRYFYGRHTEETLAKAAEYFQKAITLDQNYARAWVALGECFADQAGRGFVPIESGYGKAREAVERALSIDPDLPEANAAMGGIKMLHDFDWSGAAASFKRALALKPGDVSVIRRTAYLERIRGHPDEAIALYRRAIEIDPLEPNAYGNLGLCLHYAGRQEQAAVAFRKILELQPESPSAHWGLALVELARSDPEKALAEANQEKHPVLRLTALALAHYALKQKNESDANFAELINRFQAQAPYQIAEVYAFRGEANRALQWLDQAYTGRDAGLAELKVDPLLVSLRSDARYVSMLKKMHLA